ncbi:MAG: hypothetical protein LBM78_01175 [Clostridiales bacterium]|nr:hypothetical protein [Clostridiales bacterium]
MEKINILWTPVSWFWNMIFVWFTPSYWGVFMTMYHSLMDMPPVLRIIALIIVAVLAAIIWLILVIILLVILLVLSVIVAIVWLLAMVGNGIFHFTDWDTKDQIVLLVSGC